MVDMMGADLRSQISNREFSFRGCRWDEAKMNFWISLTRVFPFSRRSQEIELIWLHYRLERALLF
jgi:hypothetical protein